MFQTPRVYLAPRDGEVAGEAPDVKRLTSVARTMAATLACSAVEQYQAHTSPAELLQNHSSFELWFMLEPSMLRPGWTPPPGLISCLGDCAGDACVEYLMSDHIAVHNSSASAIAAVREIDVNSVCPFVVETSSMSAEAGLDYTIRQNHTDVPSTKPNFRYYKFFGEPPKIYRDYWGFVNLESLLDRSMMGVLRAERDGELSEGGTAQALPLTVSVQPFPWQEYTLDVGAIAASGFFDLLIIFAFIIPSKSIVTTLVEEKEQRLREGMMLLGLRPALYWGTWFVNFFGMLAFTSAGMAAIGTYCFEYSSALVIYAFYLSCAFAIVSFSFWLSTFFSSGKVASVMAVFLYIAFRIPGIVVTIVWPDGGPLDKWVMLLPPSAIGYFVRTLTTLEIGQFGVTAETLHTDIFDNPHYPLSPLEVIQMLVLDGFLYGLLTWYTDHVIPKEWGTALPWYFPFMPSYWSRERRERAERERAQQVLSLSRSASAASMASGVPATSGRAGTAAAAEGSKGVHIQNLTKVFGDKVAVDGVDLSMHAGEVTALLGHNGAGKTTTIALLTGMLQPTQGDALIDGLSVSEDMGAIRRSLGLCPQFDILWPSITVREHLEIFARIKGAPSTAVAAAEAVRAARSVDLGAKIDTPASALSGGQRRKLSLAIAFMGDPRVVFLDEPTSGMDPYARRFSWDVIRAHRRDRVIVLTTHFLDEADLLADRVAIMASGQVAAVGSPLELKAQYGCGYVLTITLAPGVEHNEAVKSAVAAHVGTFVPGAERAGGAAAEIRLNLPQAESARFPALLRSIEDDGADLGISGFGVSCTTLEDVFLRVGEDVGVDDKDDAEVGGSQGYEQESHALLLGEPGAGGRGGRIHAHPTFLGQFVALLYKRVCWMKRDKLAFTVQLGVPVLCVVLAQIAGRAGAKLPAQPRLAMIRDNCMAGLPAAAAAADAVRDGIAGLASVVWESYPSADVIDSHMNRTCVDNVTCKTDGLLNSTLPGFLLDTWFHGPDTYDGFMVHAPEAGAETNTSMHYTILANQTAYHALPASLAEMDSVVFNALFGSIGASVRVFNEPLPYGEHEAATYALQMANDSLLVLCAGMAIAILSAGCAVFVVRERACGARHVQMVSGVSSLAYWLATYAFDLIFFLLPLAAIMATFFAFGLPQYVGKGAIAVALLLLTFAAASLPLTYLLQRLFDNELKALTRLTLLYFLFAFCAAMATIVVQILAAQDIGHTRAAYDVMQWVFRIIPHYCVCKGLFDLSSNHLGILAFVTPPYTPRTFGPLDMDVTGWQIVFLAGEAVIFSLLLLLVENPPDVVARAMRAGLLPTLLGALSPGGDGSAAAGAARAAQEGDAAVAEEKRTAAALFDASAVELSGSGGDAAPLVVKDLHKVYPSGKVAVSSVSFVAERDHVFGLLGVNGAGKTTTFRALTGEIQPSGGDARVNGCSVVRDLREARTHLGYCPQFDATLPLLTAREHLCMYARLRGASRALAAAMSEDLLGRVGLRRHADKPSHALSGGNRRKLSVAIALVSAPECVLMDEPSTGMDAGARRAMWAVLDAERVGRAIVLTSHSMEEVEATCDRLTIMVDGAMRSIGTLQELKSRYGTGYTMAFRVRNAKALAELDAFVMQTFPGAKATEQSTLTAKYNLPTVSAGVNGQGDNAEGGGQRLSDAFAAVEREVGAEAEGGGRVGHGGIVEYSVTQATLEDVFIGFARTSQETQE